MPKSDEKTSVGAPPDKLSQTLCALKKARFHCKFDQYTARVPLTVLMDAIALLEAQMAERK